MVVPFWNTVKCRCGPVDAPVLPMYPMTLPLVTYWPAEQLYPLRWPQSTLYPFPTAYWMQLPYAPYHDALVMYPSAMA